MGFFIPATAKVTAIANAAIRTANFLFISFILLGLNFLKVA